MSAAKPTILIIHGAWHTPTHYAGLKSHLEGLGYPVILPLLPTCNNNNPPTSTLQDDIDLIRKTAKDQISSGKKVIAVMHSYGGIVGTAALTGLAPQPDSAAVTGGLKALIYICAFVPHEKQSLAGMFAETGLPPWLKPNAETGFLDVEDPGYHFYSDLPAEEKEKWVKELVVHPIVAQTTPIGDACAWRDGVAVWYVLCEDDAALPPYVQEGMIEGLRKEGVQAKVEKSKAGHSPFLSRMEKVGEVVEKAATTSSS